MALHFLFCLFLLSCILPNQQCEYISSDFYISTTGSDVWDGTMPDHIPDTNTGPWSTFANAVTQLRELRPHQPNASHHVNLNFLPGIYFFDEKVFMNSRDSYMTIKSLYPDQDVILSGGVSLTNFLKTSGENIQTVEFNGSCGEVFYGDERLIPARSPNKLDSNDNMANEPYNTIKNLLVETSQCKRDTEKFSQTCPEENRYGFIFDAELYNEDWEYLDQTHVLVFHQWIAEKAKIANITKSGSDWKILFQEPLKGYPIGTWVAGSGWRFLFFNNKELLDSPGEYVCIQKDEVAELSFILPVRDHENDLLSSRAIKNSSSDPSSDDTKLLSDTNLFITKLGELILLNEVSNIEIKGLTFKHTSSEGYDYWAHGDKNAIRIVNSIDVLIEDGEFSNVGACGIMLRNSSRVLISRNVFHDIGFHGLDLMYQNELETPRDIKIENNIFNGCGMNSFWMPNCITVGGLENITVRNNDFSNVPFAPVRIHGLALQGANNSKYGDVSNSVYKIEYNDFNDYGLGILSDFGAVYISVYTQSVSNVPGPGCDNMDAEDLAKYCHIYAHIYNNRIRKGKAYYTSLAHGLYSDVSTCHNTFENNLIYGGNDNVFFHHCGLDNFATNNFVHRTHSSAKYKSGDQFETAWGGCGNGGQALSKPQAYENQKNIYLLDDVDGFHFGRTSDRFYNSSPVFHHNLYWSFAPGDVKSAKLFPGFPKLDWYEWQSSGNDTESMWEDPLFEDPENQNYALKEGSPAWKLGIVQIDLDHFGVESDTYSFRQIKYRKQYSIQ